MSIKVRVVSKDTNKTLSEDEVLIEVNRDRSEEWSDYTLADLKAYPEEVTDWIDRQYYDVFIGGGV